MRIKEIKFGTSYKHGYGEGAKPGMECVVEIQTGERSYNTTSLTLSNEATLRIAQAIAAEAQAMLTIDADEIDVEGAPGAPRPVEAAEMPIHDEVAL